MCFGREGEILLDGVSNFSLPRIISFTYSVVVPTCYYLAKRITVMLITNTGAAVCAMIARRVSSFLPDSSQRSEEVHAKVDAM